MAASATLSEASIRHRLLYFYTFHDPAVLRKGLDINGLVKVTLVNGIDLINARLFGKYDRAIDFFDLTVPNSVPNIGYTNTSPNLFDRRQSYLTMIKFFLARHDFAIARDNRVINTFLKYALDNGMYPLSLRFQAKYGAPLVDNQPKYLIDLFRLRRDLKLFYKEMQDVEQIQFLEDTTVDVIRNGMNYFNSKLEDLYGISLNSFNLSNKREPHAEVKFKMRIARQDLRRELMVFYSELGHKNKLGDIEAMLNYQEDEGMEALNELLHENFGLSLDDYNEILGRTRYIGPFRSPPVPQKKRRS